MKQPVALQHGYVLWQNVRQDGQVDYVVKRKDEVDESLLGMSIVPETQTKDIFFNACEHIRAVDVDIADSKTASRSIFCFCGSSN